MDKLDSEDTKLLMISISKKIIENKEWLCEIDRKIGDGDHGTGMAKGAKEVCESLRKSSVSSPGEVFRISGMAMMNSMGGSSGVLFGSFFLELGKATLSTENLTLKSFENGLDKAINAIKEKGGADYGDKTMLDALIPAFHALNEYKSEDFTRGIELAKKAANEGVEQTKRFPAKFGRAKFLGDRTLGFQDAGATSVFIILEATHEFLVNRSG